MHIKNCSVKSVAVKRRKAVRVVAHGPVAK